MQIPAYRRAVFKNVDSKSTRAGLRYLASNGPRANLFHAATALTAATASLLTTERSYLLLGKQTDEEKAQARRTMGVIAYNLIIAAKILKVKVPGSGKKIKFAGTRGLALLTLNEHVSRIAAVSGQYLTAAPAKTGGDKPKLDKVEQTKMDVQRQEAMKTEVEQTITVFYGLSLDMFGAAPADIFTDNVKAMAEHKPAGFFDPPKVDPSKKKAPPKNLKKAAAPATAAAPAQ